MFLVSVQLVIFVRKPGHRTFTWAGHLPSWAVWSWNRTPIRQETWKLVVQFLRNCLLSTIPLFWAFWTPNTLLWQQQMYWQDVNHQLMLSVTCLSFGKPLVQMHVATNRPRQQPLQKSLTHSLVLKYEFKRLLEFTHISQMSILHVARHM